MPKNKEYSIHGVREFYSVKGCNSCLECEHIQVVNSAYCCRAKQGKSSNYDRRFPYDNTKCKSFSQKANQ